MKLIAHIRCHEECGVEGSFTFAGRRECPRCGFRDVRFAVIFAIARLGRRPYWRLSVRLWLLSDLHIELSRDWDLPAPGARPDYDVLVVAGDLMPRMERGVKWLLERVTDRDVVYVGGNHEGYGTDLDRTIEKARLAAAGSNVHVLENDSVRIGDVVFLGAIGWTDFGLFGDPERAMRVAGDVMNDYKKVRVSDYSRRLHPADTLARHMRTRDFLQRELSKPKTCQARVVVTHMSFHAEGVRRGHEREEISAAYASHADIAGADLWVYGHTHESRDFEIGGTRIVSNPKGYGPWFRHETWENANFDPIFVIEI
jgi:predicted phosphodiesterase